MTESASQEILSSTPNLAEIAIKVSNLTKIYPLYNKPIDRLKEALHPFRKKYHHDFYALHDISFEIKKGETVGIIGQNGSGKSTLLKIITGVLTPTSGEVIVNGRVSSLLELGVGFNPELTGIENVYFYGTINGFTKEEMDAKLEDILSFADIGEFVYQPVKTYSSGMFVRLAFACAIQIDPEILIVDEALSVGDMFFQNKCMARMKKLMEKGVTLLFVSHDLASVKMISKRAIFLHQGKIQGIGNADEVCDYYFKKFSHDSFLNESPNALSPLEHQTSNVNELGDNLSSILKKLNEDPLFRETKPDFDKYSKVNRLQDGRACILNAFLINQKDEIARICEFGEKVTLRIYVYFNQSLRNINNSYKIRTLNGLNVVYKDFRCLDLLDNFFEKEKLYIFNWEFILNLQHEKYTITTGITIPPEFNTSDRWEFVDFIPSCFFFTMLPKKKGMIDGYVEWDSQVAIKKVEV
ncbi:MAG: ABC transporter ATP-binding protein [Leptospiraceae bacterium]|nr:ABC transporter ATP-binding protein [Leptospiraceae bacterium]